MSNSEKQNRRSIRLGDYDYRSNGAYFITICIEQKKCLLGHLENGTMKLNHFGEIVDQEWLRSFEIRKEIIQDEYIIMPNHFHAIVWINRSEVSSLNAVSDIVRKPQSLSTLVSGFKGSVTRRVNTIRGTSEKFWQRNYYEHIIRTEDDLYKIQYYIRTNPESWRKDSLYNAD